jgi:hypothetical protein
MRRSSFTRTVQKSGSRERSTRWNFSPGWDGSTWRSKAVVLTAFVSAWVSRRSAVVKLLATRKFTR